ncbi:hypothetical protein LEP1GSC051_4463 [Leptospira sp. P2653]|nr:hypothetical protein LEP1GSC051_4463 [Leptospira sp. P2653]
MTPLFYLLYMINFFEYSVFKMSLNSDLRISLLLGLMKMMLENERSILQSTAVLKN